MKDDTQSLSSRIVLAFESSDLGEEKVRQIAFHLSDCQEDLIEMAGMLTSASHQTDEQIRESIIRFLAHVPDHLAAARKLIGLGAVSDVFGVNALEDDD